MSATVISSLSGFFKARYADKLEDLVPRKDKFLKLVDFVKKDKQPGDTYHEPVSVSDSQGFTYIASGGGVQTLNGAISMGTQDAQILGSQIIGRSQVDYETAARGLDNERAFGNVFDVLVQNLMESTTKRLELACLYGRSGIGQIAAGSKVSATATTITLTISTAHWAAGIWAGLENAQVYFYTTGGTLVSSGDDSIFTVTSVDSANRQVTFTGTATGVTALDTSEDSNAHDIFFYGTKTADMYGIDQIMRNTGTMFNIDASTYNMWKSNTHTVTGQLTFAKLLTGVSKATERGLDEDVIAMVNPRTWQDLNSDLAALRSFDSSYKPAEGVVGNEGIVYHGQNGKIEVVPHIFVKEGDCFVFPPDQMIRVGAQDLSFIRPGSRTEEIFFDRQDQNAYEFRCYSNQGVLCHKPARCVKVSGFTNSS